MLQCVKTFLIISMVGLLFGQNLNAQITNTQEELGNLHIGLWADSVIHLVWDLEPASEPVTYVLEKSTDGYNFAAIDKLVIGLEPLENSSSFPNRKILISNETGTWKGFYNDFYAGNYELVYRPEYKYRVRREIGSRLIYSKTVSTTRFDVQIYGETPRYTQLLKEAVAIWRESTENNKSNKSEAFNCPQPIAKPAGYNYLLSESTTPCGTCEMAYYQQWTQQKDNSEQQCGIANCVDPCKNGDGTPIHSCAEYHLCTCTPWPGCEHIPPIDKKASREIKPLDLNISVGDKKLSCGQNSILMCVNTNGANTDGWTFKWSPGGKSGNCVNLTAGTYTVTVTNKEGCSSNRSAKVIAPDFWTNVKVNNSTVACGTKTTVEANPKSGAGPYKYKWSNGATTKTTSYGGGKHWVTVTGAGGCKATRNFTINENKPVAAVVAHGSCTDDIWGIDGNGSKSPGSTITKYTWIFDTGEKYDDKENDGITYHKWNTNGTHEVKLVVTDANGCTDTGSTSVQVRQSPAAALEKTDAGCGTSSKFGSATANYTNWWGTATYEWNTGATTKTINNLGPGKYWVTITGNNGCTAKDTVEIEQGGLGGSLPNGNVSCPGDSDGWAKARPKGGDGKYSFKWSDSNGKVIGTDSTIDNLAAGSYTVHVEDGAGCFVNAGFTIEEPDKLSGAMNKIDIHCQGDMGSISPVVTQGGQAPYELYTTSGQSATNVDAGDTTFFGGLQAGWDTLKVVDINGCDWNVSFQIKKDSIPMYAVTQVIADATCAGVVDASIYATAIGGTAPYTYEWNKDGAFPEVNDTLSGVGPGEHTLTITDANGCETDTFVEVAASQDIVVSITDSTASGCDRQGGNNGSAKVSVSGGVAPYSYVWDDPQAQTTADATGLAPGTYTVQVTDSKGCVGSASVTVTQLIQISYNIIKYPSCVDSCKDGIVEVIVGGQGTAPYTYRWNDPGQQTTARAEGLATGTYTAIVFDDNDCYESKEIVLVDEGSVIGIDPAQPDSELKFAVYPNPTTGKIWVDLGNTDLSGYHELSVFSISGQVVYQGNLSSRRQEVDLHSINKGFYFIQIKSENGIWVKKIILE